jgi:RNA polymerase sigma factor (sigma-70 family)
VSFRPLILRIALRMGFRHTMRSDCLMTLDDAMQSGYLGLMVALERWDASKGASLETFASIKIRCAILDAARGGRHPRSVETIAMEHIPERVDTNTPDEVADCERRLESLYIPPRERQAFLLGLHGATLKDIGIIMGIHESRVFQLAKVAAMKLRAVFQ